ncbi:MAG: hypothetical protein J1G38_04135 [Clostridiales bacterium]|nr:hypothetical protein [Clostridiales bacterium]
MANLEYLHAVRKKLHDINFGKDGIVRPIKAQDNAQDYGFEMLERPQAPQSGKKSEWVKRCHKYPENEVCYCVDCDGITDRPCGADNPKMRFTSITHGAHTLDFLDAHGVGYDTASKWSDKPVLFVFENPGAFNSVNYGADGVSEPTELPPAKRKPCNWWYWINGQDDESYTNADFVYPNWFSQKEYGWMVYSAINTFRIANAYVTNLVKCGVGSTVKDYVTTDKYDAKVVDNCVGKHLLKEIAALRGGRENETVTVFAFGERVYNKLTEEETKKALGPCEVHQLPHPANRLSNDYRKYVLLSKILCGLWDVGFYKGVAPVTFDELLLSGKQEDSFAITRELLGEKLEKYFEEKREEFARDGKSFEPSTGYLKDKFTYQVCGGKEGAHVVFRYKHKDNDKDYYVSWVSYYAETGEIYLYKGADKKATSAEEFVDRDHDDYIVYAELNAFIDYLYDSVRKENARIRLKEIVAATSITEE